MKTVYCVLFWMTFSLCLTAQESKSITFVSTMNPEGASKIHSLLEAETIIEYWDKDYIRFWIEVKSPTTGRSSLKTLAREGRYRIGKRQLDEETMQIAMLNLDKNALTDRMHREQLTIKMFVPRFMIVHKNEESLVQR